MHETFTVVRGSILVTADGREAILNAGDEHTVKPGGVYEFTGYGGEATVTRVTMERPGRMAKFLETFYELNRAGRTDAAGMPSFPQIAITGAAIRHDIRTVIAPWPAQLVMFAVLSPIARLRGLKPFYVTDELSGSSE